MPRQPTIRHRRAAKLVAENGGDSKSIGEVMKKAGYSDEIMRNPQKVTNSEGFQMALAEYGLTKELVVTALSDDIKAKPANRVKELALAANILRLTQQGGNVVVGNTINLNEDRNKYA